MFLQQHLPFQERIYIPLLCDQHRAISESMLNKITLHLLSIKTISKNSRENMCKVEGISFPEAPMWPFHLLPGILEIGWESGVFTERRFNLVFSCTACKVYTYIHTYMHTYIHTYVHTYIYTYLHETLNNRGEKRNWWLKAFVASVKNSGLRKNGGGQTTAQTLPWKGCWL